MSAWTEYQVGDGLPLPSMAIVRPSHLLAGFKLPARDVSEKPGKKKGGGCDAVDAENGDQFKKTIERREEGPKTNIG